MRGVEDAACTFDGMNAINYYVRNSHMIKEMFVIGRVQLESSVHLSPPFLPSALFRSENVAVEPDMLQGGEGAASGNDVIAVVTSKVPEVDILRVKPFRSDHLIFLAIYV